jgi:MFS family permease
MTTADPASAVGRPIRLGIRENLAQFALLDVVNACVGAVIGMERTILPALAEQEFHLVARTAMLSFIVVFGVTKALTNYATGRLADRYGRKRILVVGWLIALPVPFLLMWAPNWNWVVLANVLLGVNQGLTWSTTVIMKIDLVGGRQRGLAMGLNECAGYLALGASALLTGWIAARYRLRPEPFFVGVGGIVAGLALSALFVRDTADHVTHEQWQRALSQPQNPGLAYRTVPAREVFWRTTLWDRSLSSVSQAGLVNNLNDGMAWGLFPLVFAGAGLTLADVGVLAAVYPIVWSVGQLVTGPWSDHVGRKPFIVWGMWAQAFAIVLVSLSSHFAGFITGMALLGVGTAMVYPTLLASIADITDPSWRASAIGVYRLWRDLGYAVGALVAGTTADLLGLTSAMYVVAVLTFGSGVVAALRMRETLPSRSIP